MALRTLSVMTVMASQLIGPMAQAADTETVSADVIAAQRAALATSTDGAGYGPQPPRDIDAAAGANTRSFGEAPAYTAMNLCNIHMHKNAEHQGGQFRSFAGPGNGKGYGTGYKYDGELTAAESVPLDRKVGDKGYGGLSVGDTIEVHYVHTTAQVKPGPTLGACLSEAIGNPQLRVETQVFVLVNGAGAADFGDLTKVGQTGGYYQAVNMSQETGTPVQYEGSTTGPSYNEKGSPFQVSWSVRPQVIKLDITSVETWFKSNIFNEDHAHGVRNLVQNPALLSAIN